MLFLPVSLSFGTAKVVCGPFITRNELPVGTGEDADERGEGDPQRGP